MCSFYTLQSRRGVLYGLWFTMLVSRHAKSFKAPSNLNQCFLSRYHSQPKGQQKGVAQNEPRTHRSYMQENIKTFKNFISFRGYDWQIQRERNSLCPSCKGCFARTKQNPWNSGIVECCHMRFEQLHANDTRHFTASVRQSGDNEVWHFQTISKSKPCLGCQLPGLTGCFCPQLAWQLQDLLCDVFQLNGANVNRKDLLMAKNLGCIDLQASNRPTAAGLRRAQPLGASDFTTGLQKQRLPRP